ADALTDDTPVDAAHTARADAARVAPTPARPPAQSGTDANPPGADLAPRSQADHVSPNPSRPTSQSDTAQSPHRSPRPQADPVSPNPSRQETPYTPSSAGPPPRPIQRRSPILLVVAVLVMAGSAFAVWKFVLDDTSPATNESTATAAEDTPVDQDAPVDQDTPV